MAPKIVLMAVKNTGAVPKPLGIDLADETPISYGLNSKLVKKDGKVMEDVYMLSGLYGDAISRIIFWLDEIENVLYVDHIGPRGDIYK